MYLRLFTAFISCLILVFSAVKAQGTTLPYRWEQVAIGGGGYVTGITVHPLDRERIYIRTDVGGAFRWDAEAGRWQTITDGLAAINDNFNGIGALAVDPQDVDTLYIAAGAYTKETLQSWWVWQPGMPEPTDIFKSTDGGESWVSTGLHVSVNANGSAWRISGERLAVDPHDSRVVYYGSWTDGMWRSGDAGASWTQVEGLPVAADPGFTFVAFDASSGAEGAPTQTIYTWAAGEGLYRSTDAGATWSLVPGAPSSLVASRGVVAADGSLYFTSPGNADVAGAGGVWKFDGDSWSDISPRHGGQYNALAVAPSAPNIVTVASFAWGFEQSVWRSEDSGRTWTEVRGDYASTVPWKPNFFAAAAPAGMAIDPQNPARVWMTDWYSVWQTDDVSAQPARWTDWEDGHEETVILALASLPSGDAPLFSGVADIDGFRHADLSVFPDEMMTANIAVQETTSFDFAEDNPNFVVRVGGSRDQRGAGAGFYSQDAGVTWVPFASLPPGADHGRVALSADGANIVWLSVGGQPFASSDIGESWTVGMGAPGGMLTQMWEHHQPLASDRVLAGRFYLLDQNRLYRSEDGGANWARVSTLPVEGGGSSIVAAPGIAGEIWALVSGQVFRSSDAGETFTAVSSIESTRAITFGAPASGSDSPAIYIVGSVDGVAGIYRSDDLGASWGQLDGAVIPSLTVIAADRQVYGRVYIGTGGRGIFYGEAQS
jgi:hypothetical protein